MASTAFLAPLAGSKLVRRAADALLLRYAHHRTASLDRMDAAQVQHDTLLRLVRRARDTKFGRDHDFLACSSLSGVSRSFRTRLDKCRQGSPRGRIFHFGLQGF